MMCEKMSSKKATAVVITIAAVAILGSLSVRTIQAANPPPAAAPSDQILAQRECPEQAQKESDCSIVVQVGPDRYSLTGKAYEAYQELENREFPYQALKLQSNYISAGERFALSIEGSSDKVTTLVNEYDITKLADKVNPENNHMQLFGTISKDNLGKFLSQNTVDNLRTQGIVISPLGGYVANNESSGNLNTFITESQQETLAKELTQFKQTRLNDIVSQATGVEKLAQ